MRVNKPLTDLNESLLYIEEIYVYILQPDVAIVKKVGVDYENKYK